METKASGLLEKFQSMKAHAREIYDILSKLENIRIQAQSGLVPEFNKVQEIMQAEREKIQETIMLLDEYNQSRIEVDKVVKFSIPYFSRPNTLSEAKGVLRQVSVECDEVIGVLRSLIIPVSPEDADKLNKLRAEIAEVTIKLDPAYEKNLNQAINEYEKGDYLASALITARVIIYILSQIEGKTDEEKIRFLQDRNIIKKDREDMREFIIKASKKARHFFSHDIKIFADPSDAIGMLGDSVKLLKIWAKLEG